MSDKSSPTLRGRWLRSDDLRRFLFSVGPTGASAFAQLVIFALTARAIGPDQFGLLAVVYGFCVISTEMTALGADTAMVRRVALDSEGFQAAWGNTLALFLISYPPLVLATTFAAGWFAAASFSWVVVAMLVLGELLVGRAVSATELAMIAHNHAVRASWVRLSANLARAATALVVFVLLGVHDIRVWAVATLLQSIVCAIALLLVTHRLYGAARPRILRSEIGFGLLLMLNHLSRSLTSNLDRIVLAPFLTPAALGVYASGTRPQLVNGILNQAATRLFFVRFFRAGASGRDQLRAFTRSTAAKMVLVGIAAGVIIAIIGQLLPIVLGAGYGDSALIAAALALASPFISLQTPPADALTASDKQFVRTLIYFAVAVASAGLLTLGAVLAGIWGAVAAVILSQALLAAVLWAVFLLDGGSAR